MNLLLGNLTPEHGEIKIGGQSIKNIGSNKLRNFIAYVAQDDVLFAGSILENISFFDDGAQQDWVEQCAKMASVHDEIMAMPMGYQTLVGDMGNILSVWDRSKEYYWQEHCIENLRSYFWMRQRVIWIL